MRAQIEAFAEAEGLQISGYYAAAENFEENSVERAPGLKIADKIVELAPNACLVMVSCSFVSNRSEQL